MAYHALELTVVFKYRTADISRSDFVSVYGALKRWVKPGLVTSHSLVLLVVTDESASSLVERVRPEFDTIGSVLDWTVKTAGRDACGRNGSLCPYSDAVAKAWSEVEERREAKNMGKRRPANAIVEDGLDKLDLKATIKAGLRGPWKGKPQTDPRRNQG